MIKRLIPLLQIGTAAAAVALPAGALAHRAATQTQRAAVLAAVVDQHQLSQAQAACQWVTISTVDTTWAMVFWPAHLSKACEKVAANGVIVEHYRPHAWHFVTVGSDFACTVGGMPAKVGRDLLPTCAA